MPATKCRIAANKEKEKRPERDLKGTDGWIQT